MVFLVVAAAGGIVLLGGLALNLFSYFVGGWPELTSLVIGPTLIFLGMVGFAICKSFSDD